MDFQAQAHIAPGMFQDIGTANVSHSTFVMNCYQTNPAHSDHLVAPEVYSNKNSSFILNSPSSQLGTSSNPDPIFNFSYSVYPSTLTGQEFSLLSGSTPSLSPVTHQTTSASLVPPSLSAASSLSPPLPGADSLFTIPAVSPLMDPDSSTSAAAEGTPEGTSQWRSKYRKAIVDGGNSIFALPLQKSDYDVSDQNLEILAAFKAVRADPQFRVLIVIPNFNMTLSAQHSEH